MTEIYGYVRVSAKDQNEERQLIAMRDFGLPEERVFVEKQSGKDFERPVYKKLMRRLRENDTLVIQSIDRLGRNYGEIIEQWRTITKHKKASIVVLDMPLLDTREKRDLIGTLIGDIVLQLLSFVAETEREKIKSRQAEGIAAAKARGVRFGRPEKTPPPEFRELYSQWLAKEISGRKAANRLGVAPQTFLRWGAREGNEAGPAPSANDGR